MSYYVPTGDAALVGDSDSWGGPMDGVDLDAQAGIALGGTSWHTRITVELWTLIIILGAVAALWILGTVFRTVNVF